MLDWRVIVPLGCASLALGALAPWVMPSTAASSHGSPAVPQEEPGPPGADVAAAAPPQPRLQGVIALGDAAMMEAQQCLEDRGVHVYPGTVDTQDDLIAALENVVADYAAVLIHVGTQAGLVDGQIRDAIDTLGEGRRLVWATVVIPEPEWGAFSFEERTNASIRGVVGRYSEGRVLDWRAATAKHPEWTVDGVTMSTEGCREYAAKAARLSGVARPK